MSKVTRLKTSENYSQDSYCTGYECQEQCCSIQEYNRLHKPSDAKDAYSMIREVRIAKRKNAKSNHDNRVDVSAMSL